MKIITSLQENIAIFETGFKQTPRIVMIILHLWCKCVLLYLYSYVNKNNKILCLSKITFLWAIWPALFMILHLAFLVCFSFLYFIVDVSD